MKNRLEFYKFKLNAKTGIKGITMGLITASALFCTASAASVGINTHWGHSNFVSPYIELANEVNAEWLRDGYNWSGVEKEKGVYSIPNPGHGNMPREAKKNDLGMVYVLGFGNCLYDGCETSQDHKVIPYEGEYLEAWKNYVRFTATEFKGMVDVYEVWNEPDIGSFNSNGITGEQYVKLLKATKEVLNEVDPQAKTAGAVVTNEGYFKWGKTSHEYLEKILAAGGGEYMDILSVHIYTQKFTQSDGGDGACNYTDDRKTPEAAYRDWLGYFETSFDKYGYTKDVWLTEAGWYTGDSEYAVSEEVQAKYLIRQAVIWEDYLKKNSRNGEMILYQARDGSGDGALFGVQKSNGANKKSYYSLKAYNTFLKNTEFDSLTETTETYLATYNSVSTADKVYVAWSPDSEGSVQIELSGDQTNIYDYQGNLIESITSDGSTKTIAVDDFPKFIECVEHRVVIDTAVYNKDKNLITVTGRSNVEDTVDISLKKGETVLETKKVAVDENDEFTAVFAPLQSGELTVYAGTDKLNDSQDIAVSFGSDLSFVNTGAIALYDGESREITVSGSIANYTETTNSTVAVVRSGRSVPYTKNDLLYIGQTELHGGNFTYSFKLLNQTPGRYDVVLGGTDVSEALVKGFLIPADSEYYAVLDSSSVSSSSVSATVNLVNSGKSEKDATLIICQYDNDMKLISANIFEEKVSAADGDTPSEKTVSGTVPISCGAKVFKAFVWEDLKTGKPVSEALDLR